MNSQTPTKDYNTFTDSIFSKLFRLSYSLLFDPAFFWYTATCLLIGEVFLNIFIIKYVSYTEIDWKAYMKEVSIFLNGERNYTKIQGDTGPCVYPAGFVYIYSILNYITSEGVDILKAQYIFAILYMWTLYVVFNIYHRYKQIPPYVLIFLCLSKRLHSIFVLRLFNDVIAMAFLYTCIWTMINKKWKLSCVFYSLALSVKMNILLYFPAFGVLLFKSLGARKTFNYILLVVLVQIILAFPFLITYPRSYLGQAFEFSRVFLYKWTVNWKFVTEETFLSSGFSKGLLIAHVWVLIAFLFGSWCRSENGVLCLLRIGFFGIPSEIAKVKKMVTADHITMLMLTSNFIGIVFSRTLHYQFYSWYFHGLPYLLWHCTKIPVFFRFGIIAAIEYCWNVYPATSESSALLFACHLMVLMGLWSGDSEGKRITYKK
ncbi:glycosyltransferase family 58 protein [Gigaspora rosea]|uniref:Dol-P-Man:Man(5)GlcNAc(2)-PP-Dol alpha-1,3-mannosyltransferase n=1 Tax=Gigaspora rosea TaxID=44941 RepID=A0A397U336_9GLOM|nr:glycosyltransferase family 58 protein [Gigaspora rosea]